MNCAECKARSIPYVVHESAMARADRREKRLTAIIALLIVLLAGTNAYWIWNESQYEDVYIEADQGDGTNIVSGGDLSYGAEGENPNP